MRGLTLVVWIGPIQCLGYVRSTPLPIHADVELSLPSVLPLKHGLRCTLEHLFTIPCLPGLRTWMLLGMTLDFPFSISRADARVSWTRLCDGVGGQSLLESDFKCDISFVLYLRELLNNQLNAELFGNAQMHATAGSHVHLIDRIMLEGPRIRASE